MNHTPSPVPDAPDPSPSLPPSEHPDKQPNETPQIVYEQEIVSSNSDEAQPQPEIRHVPNRPEISSIPESR